MGVPILDQLPFTGIERDPRPEETAQALHLQWSDVVANWETRSGVKGFLDVIRDILEKEHLNMICRVGLVNL